MQTIEELLEDAVRDAIYDVFMVNVQINSNNVKEIKEWIGD